MPALGPVRANRPPVVRPDAPRLGGGIPSADRIVSRLILVAEAATYPGSSCRDLRAMGVTHASFAGGSPHESPMDGPGLSLLASAILPFFAADRDLLELLGGLHALGGDATLVKSLCAFLFGNAPAGGMGGEGQESDAGEEHSALTRREIDILTEATRSLSQEEIGERLGISTRTVGTHFENIYRKLGVKRPLQAVVRAASLGYIQFGPEGVASAPATNETVSSVIRVLFRDRAASGGGAAGTVGVNRAQSPKGAAAKGATAKGATAKGATAKGASKRASDAGHSCRGRLLADIGMLFLLLSAAMGLAEHNDPEVDGEGGCVLAGLTTENGRNAFVPIGTEYVVNPQALAVAPTHAARCGFTPGHIYVADAIGRIEGLNTVRILEFTPAGRFVGAFTGARELGASLSGAPSLCFASDGRLLATSTWLTEGILAFRDGGQTVERLASGIFDRIACDRTGVIYAVSGHTLQQFTPAGRPSRSRIHWPEHTECAGLACDPSVADVVADDSPVLYALLRTPEAATLNAYDAAGNSIWTTPAPVGASGLAVDSRARCYVADPQSGAICMFEKGRHLHPPLAVETEVRPTELAVGPDRRVFVCGAGA